ncbi:MAG: M56 family metallopeptidase [Pseudobdellovibrionaceae bacterium]
MAVIFFNLFVNATFSLLLSLTLVLVCSRVLRVHCGPWKLFLLSLPFIKVIYDFLKGVPQSSVLVTHIDPYRLPPGVQNFTLGIGLNNYIPQIKALFTVYDYEGNKYGASVGDYVVYWLAHKLSPDCPLYIVYFIAFIAGILLLRRVLFGLFFEIQRRRDRRHCRSLERRSLSFRSVDIYLSDFFSGTPFTGGIFKPYICIPKDAFENLSPSELEAVIAHELGHVEQMDLLLTIVIGALGDLFWFVPAYRWLCQKLERMRELIADQRAVQAGVNPAVLAAALIKLKEFTISKYSLICYSPFVGEKPLLKIRIEHLLGLHDEKPQRWVWRNIWSRSLITFWIMGAVLSSNFGGNHSTHNFTKLSGEKCGSARG